MKTWQILMNSDDIGTIRIDISCCWFLRRSSNFHRFDIFDDYGWTMMNTLTCWWVPTRGFLNRFNTHQFFLSSCMCIYIHCFMKLIFDIMISSVQICSYYNTIILNHLQSSLIIFNHL
jgi:hypothetical protein